VAGCRNSKVITDLLKDIFETGRLLNARIHCKGKPIGLIGIVVGILPQDYDLNLIERC
jgi:hypothetical protein